MAVETFERPIRHVSWSAIFCGVVVAMAVEGLLSFVGNAIGLMLINPFNFMAQRTLETGAVLWTLGIPLASLFIGGLLAGLLAGHYTTLDSVVTALVVWALVGLFEVSLAALLAFGSMAPARGAANLVPFNAALWLMFFSACLSLLGSIAGSLIAVRPRVQEKVYREQRVVTHQS